MISAFSCTVSSDRGQNPSIFYFILKATFLVDLTKVSEAERCTLKVKNPIKSWNIKVSCASLPHGMNESILPRVVQNFVQNEKASLFLSALSLCLWQIWPFWKAIIFFSEPPRIYGDDKFDFHDYETIQCPKTTSKEQQPRPQAPQLINSRHLHEPDKAKKSVAFKSPSGATHLPLPVSFPNLLGAVLRTDFISLG